MLRLRLLLIEDDLTLGARLKRALERAGFAIDWTTSGADGLAALKTQDYGTALLDLTLPELHGWEVLRKARLSRIDTPVIICSGRQQAGDKAAALDAGADGYVSKPFDIDEIIAQIRALVRRREGLFSGQLSLNGLVLNTNNHTLERDGECVALTGMQYRLLSLLMHRRGRYVAKSDIETALYDDAACVESNTVEVLIYSLRKKLGPGNIISGRGLGYMIPA